MTAPAENESLPFGASKSTWQLFASNPAFLPDLLPIVCDPQTPISKNSSLSQLGKSPSLINASDEAHGIAGWTKHTTTLGDVERWQDDDRLGICLQTRNHKAFDVDVEDEALADRIEILLRAFISELAGVAPDDIALRFRNNSNKFAILVACDAMMPKRALDFGTGRKLEFLGNGQQCVVAGTHPSGSQIKWTSVPTSTPVLTEDQINSIWGKLEHALADLIVATSVCQPADPYDFLAGFEPKLGLTTEKMEGYLDQLDPDMFRPDWIKVMMALFHETEGDDTGFYLFNDWSALGAKYPGEDELRKQWESLEGRNVKGQRQVTMASVIHMTKDSTLRVASVMSAAAPAMQAPLEAERSQAPLPAPFRGFMAAVVEIALSTAPKPQPGMTVLGVVLAMASTCSGHFQFPDGMRLNSFGLSVSPTTSGKDHVQRVTKSIVRAGGAQQLGDFASGAGLEDALDDWRGMISVVDEIAHTLAARGERGNPHLKEVEKMLLRLFSASNDIYYTRVKAGTKGRAVEHPCLSLLGYAVPSKLGAALSEGDIMSGLLNRMLFAQGDGNVPPQPGRQQRFALTQQMTETLDAVRLAGAADNIIQISDEAEARIEELKYSFHADMMALPEETAERVLLGRTLEKAVRLAGVLSVFDAPVRPVLSTEHLEWACSFTRGSDAAMLNFIRQHMHGGKVQADAAKVKSAAAGILRNGGPESSRPSEIAAIKASYVPVSLLSKRTGLNHRELADAIEQLVVRGDVARTKYHHATTAGRTGGIDVVFFPE